MTSHAQTLEAITIGGGLLCLIALFYLGAALWIRFGPPDDEPGEQGRGDQP